MLAQQGMSRQTSTQGPSFSFDGARASPASSFRLTIDGIDCSRVAKVGSIAITFLAGGGLERAALRKRASTATYSPLVVSVEPRYVPPFQQWLAQGGVKNGSLTFFTSDFSTPILIVNFSGLHVQSIANDVTANSQNLPRSMITMSFTGLSISAQKVSDVVAPR